jgi:Cu2+-exporting ATPase
MEKVNVIITDKTGTLTEGKPSLTQIFSENIPENEALQLALLSIKTLNIHFHKRF